MSAYSNLSSVLLYLILVCEFIAIDGICNICDCWEPTNNTILVDCAAKQLSKVLPEWPESRKHLFISFANNQIKYLNKIPEVRVDTISLSLRNCSIESIESSLFIDAVNIEHLDLSWNLLEFEDLSENVFRGPYNTDKYEQIALREINLSYNHIRNLEKYIFEHTPNLTYLDLSGNPIYTLTNNMWINIYSLNYLNSLILRNVSLREIKESSLNNEISKVKHLDLSDNQLTNIPTSLRINFPSLEILNIDSNPIEKLSEQSFLGMYLL